MRDFDDADRQKKSLRIQLPENPTNLSEEMLTQLESAVKASIRDGYVPCPAAWKIAKDAGVPRIAVGAVTDRLGVRVTGCQLGCFKVDKTPYDGPESGNIDTGVADRIEALQEKDERTCANVFALAKELNLKPMTAANAANVR
ncbi:MAG: hypothetical protein MUO19_07970, partial [Dehalococcoidales bacterium]|nr:hypothetical protein [Dehalococcoidales bacterium]